jgi:hypothetical protein
MINLLTLDEFKKSKRELMLDYKNYEADFLESIDTFDVVQYSLKNPSPDAKEVHFMHATEQRAWDSIDHLTMCYSAGHALTELRAFYPNVLAYWESFAKYHIAFHDTIELESQKNHPHFALPGDGFEQVNRMVCFSILLVWGNLMPRLLKVIDYNNHEADGMLERIFAFFVNDRAAPPDECLRHLPYFKTLKIFKAAPEQRAELMAEYLEDWYHASRRESYHDSHQDGRSGFRGYWSWEAAAITFLLEIDDVSYRDAMFYPKDLVEFARTVPSHYNPPGSTAPESDELRARAGEPCPKTGLWESMDIPTQTRAYQQNDIMDNLGSAYGLTVWRHRELGGIE